MEDEVVQMLFPEDKLYWLLLLLISPELLVLVKVRWLELILFDEDEDGPVAVEGAADDALFQ